MNCPICEKAMERGGLVVQESTGRRGPERPLPYQGACYEAAGLCLPELPEDHP